MSPVGRTSPRRGRAAATKGSSSHERYVHTSLLVLILLAQVHLGATYARETPAWQSPDEPAHATYVARLADPPHRFPILEAGDHDAGSVALVMARRWPEGRSVAGFAYEDHQPPLYYLLLALSYPQGMSPTRALPALRLTGVLLALLTTCFTWVYVRTGWPGRPRVALAAAGIVAFTPMHVAITASANNDALAIPVCAAALAVATREATSRTNSPGMRASAGLLVGLAFLTKLGAYAAALPVALAAFLQARSRGARRRSATRSALEPLALGALVAAPWWLRNVSLYGWRDPLAQRVHADLVNDQLTTAAFVEEFGLVQLLERGVVFTFDSFWGVFGWLSVFLPAWIYVGLAGACVASGLGFAVVRNGAPRTRRSGTAALCGAVLAAGVLAGFVWYNLGFVQHQGRYLLPALPVVATFLALGSNRVALVLGRWSVKRQIGVPAGRRALPDWSWGVTALWPIGLYVLAWWSLTRYVMPGLAPVS